MDSLVAGDPRQIGPYKILARLGQGGMGIVYLAQNSSQLVAVKVISPDKVADAEYQNRFRPEVQKARQVRSPYLAAFVQADTALSPRWYATEYVPGLTLEETVSEMGGLPYSTAIDLVRDLLLAARSIHGANVVHRDLKPSNVLLTPKGARIVDLCIAHGTADPRLTSSGSLIGTVTYMCPEQINGGNPTAAWDVFAIGGMLVYAMSGHPPFGNNHAAPGEVLASIVHDEPNLHGVDSRLHGFIRSLLAKNPAMRPPVEKLLDALPYRPRKNG